MSSGIVNASNNPATVDLEEYINKLHPVFVARWRRGAPRFIAYNITGRPILVQPPFPEPLKREGLERVPRLNGWLREETILAGRDLLVMHKTPNMARELVLAYLFAARRIRDPGRLARLESCVGSATPDAAALTIIGEIFSVYAPHPEVGPGRTRRLADKITKLVQIVCNVR